MENKSTVVRLNREIEAIKQQLLELGPVHPGSISSQYHACGNPSCRCHDPDNPQKHGPYNKLTYVRRGKSACRFVRAECIDELRRRLANHATLRSLVDRWIELSVQAGTMEFFGKPAETPARSRPWQSRRVPPSRKARPL